MRASWTDGHGVAASPFLNFRTSAAAYPVSRHRRTAVERACLATGGAEVPAALRVLILLLDLRRQGSKKRPHAAGNPPQRQASARKDNRARSSRVGETGWSAKRGVASWRAATALAPSRRARRGRAGTNRARPPSGGAAAHNQSQETGQAAPARTAGCVGVAPFRPISIENDRARRSSA